MRLALPSDKLTTLRSLLRVTLGVKSVSNPQAFESLVGHLVHASQVIPLGRAFLNRLFPTLRALHPGAHRRLNLGAREDLASWSLLCESWVGSSVHQLIVLDPPRHHLFTDASGSWGCGGWCMPLWFNSPGLTPSTSPPLLSRSFFLLSSQLPSGAIRGLAPLSGSFVMCHSDNTAWHKSIHFTQLTSRRATYSVAWLCFRLSGISACGQYMSQASTMGWLMLYPVIGPLP